MSRERSVPTSLFISFFLISFFVCPGGHEIILGAFDRFKDICGEKRRFQTLMDYFVNFDAFHIEFMVACTQVRRIAFKNSNVIDFK